MPGSLQLVVVFLAQAVVISLSGVMAPGAMTAATLAAGTRHRHAGALIALGHGIVEFPLMAMIMLGMGALLRSAGAKIVIGLAGGLFLLLLAGQMLKGLGKTTSPTDKHVRKSPILTGILLTGGNPLFLIWWATIGLALASRAAALGVLAFALFAVIHWLCDLAWLEALTVATFKGAKLLGDRGQRIVLSLCAAAMLAIGVKFIIDAAISLVRHIPAGQ